MFLIFYPFILRWFQVFKTCRLLSFFDLGERQGEEPCLESTCKYEAPSSQKKKKKKNTLRVSLGAVAWRQTTALHHHHFLKSENKLALYKEGQGIFFFLCSLISLPFINWLYQCSKTGAHSRKLYFLSFALIF